VVEETGSTNADLLEQAKAGAPTGSVLVADHQRAGRGRQDRTWHDQPGSSLLVSVLLRPDPATLTLIPLVTGLAATDAVGEALGAVGPAPVGLKWPNDVLAQDGSDRKLAGILAESTAEPAGSRSAPAVVVGMGLNLVLPGDLPADVQARALALADLASGPMPGRDEVLDHFLVALDRWLTRLERLGRDAVLAPYRDRCLTLGRRVQFADAAGTHTGTACEVTAEGALVLDTDAGLVTIRAGDAHHLP
jgi:BirA family biotin operon repressor/biotin-[acetyl-CoA-carboxylase] ligase